jgi:cell division protein FtsL
VRRDEHYGLAFKAIDNSRVVREVDPRANRDLWLLLLLVSALVGGILLYAWPHLQLRRSGVAAEQASRERDRLVEENRKLRLEKASLENLRRVESIATRDLGLEAPPADRQVVVETLPTLSKDARLARAKEPSPPAPAREESN